MKIEPIAEDRLRVWLNEEEAVRWQLDRDVPDRLRLRRFVRRVYGAIGHRPADRLIIEAIPVAEGWLLLIGPSSIPPKSPVIYCLDDADTLLTFIQRWRSVADAPQPGCMLYEWGDRYHLVVYPEEPLSQEQQSLLNEHTRLVGYGEVLAAHTAEYGNLIVAGNLLTECGHRPPEPSARES